MKLFPFIACGILLIFVAIDYGFRHCGQPLPDWLWILQVPLILYVWFHDWPGWKDVQDLEEKPRSPKNPMVAPPSGYTGPFWNKPSATYLQQNAKPYSAGQRSAVFIVLLIPFGVMAYMLLH